MPPASLDQSAKTANAFERPGTSLEEANALWRPDPSFEKSKCFVKAKLKLAVQQILCEGLARTAQLERLSEGLGP